MTYEFIAGFITGEGYFSNQITNKIRGNRCFSVNICVHERDRALLGEIRDFLGYGQVYGHSNDACYYSFGKNSDVFKFSETVAPFLRGYKLEQWNVFFQALVNYRLEMTRSKRSKVGHNELLKYFAKESI